MSTPKKLPGLTQLKREPRFIPMFGYSAASEDLEFFPTEHDAVSAPCENSGPKAAVERLPQT